MIINPQPSWLPVLLLALPGVILAACAVNQAVFAASKRSRSTIPAVGLVVALLPVHLAALGLGSLSYGLAAAWPPISLAGIAWGIRHRSELCGLIRLDKADWRGLGLTALATLPMIAPTLLRNFHDEGFLGGHLAIIAHLQNGVYPPRYLYEPRLPLRYHYGFDLAAAIVTGIFRIRPDQAVDALTLTLWPCTFLLLWRLGNCIGRRGAGPFVAISVCFAGTWPVWCSGGDNASLLRAVGRQMIGDCKAGSEWINHPFISYFFQHPWSLAVPIFALAVLQWSALREREFRVVPAGFLLASLALLSLAELALFIMTVAAMGWVEIWRLAHDRDRRAIAVLAVLVASAPAAKLVGGFLVSGAYPSAGGLFGTGILLRDVPSLTSAARQLLWNIESFGLLLWLGPVGLALIKRERLFLAVLAGIGLAVVNLFRYKHSWDIVKFGAVSFIALGLASGVALAELYRRAETIPRRLGLVAVILLLWRKVLHFRFSPYACLWHHRELGTQSGRISHWPSRSTVTTLLPFPICERTCTPSTSYSAGDQNPGVIQWLRGSLTFSAFLPKAAEMTCTVWARISFLRDTISREFPRIGSRACPAQMSNGSHRISTRRNSTLFWTSHGSKEPWRPRLGSAGSRSVGLPIRDRVDAAIRGRALTEAALGNSQKPAE